MSNDEFIRAYMECALWASSDDEGESLSLSYSPERLSSRAKSIMIADCLDFIQANAADLADLNDTEAGHDFWLTRNGHGTGFWDRGHGEVGDRLTAASKAYGSIDLYITDDGEIDC